jgi:hypothetical protein
LELEGSLPCEIYGLAPEHKTTPTPFITLYTDVSNVLASNAINFNAINYSENQPSISKIDRGTGRQTDTDSVV